MKLALEPQKDVIYTPTFYVEIFTVAVHYSEKKRHGAVPANRINRFQSAAEPFVTFCLRASLTCTPSEVGAQA